MPLVTQPLRDEHKELLPLLEQVKMAADAVGGGASAAEALDRAYRFLAEHLLPHAEAEEAALYPVVGRIMGSPDATKTMQVDHAKVGHLTEELRQLREQLADQTPSAEQARELRRVLYGLYTLVKVHFAKEEDVYLPLLDSHLTAEEARTMFDAMEAAAQRAKQG
ncbi:MAG: hemerythrin domain-containing protein [Armatimonadota bacterium]|nr:hemerythrin domain-containing protein [Armatimonadota bacterium]